MIIEMEENWCVLEARAILSHRFLIRPTFSAVFLSIYIHTEIHIPVWLRNRLISTGLEPVLSHTKKSCIASNYRQFSTNIKIPVLFSPGFRYLWYNKTGFNLIIFHFNFRGKWTKIQCYKYLFSPLF